MAEWVHLLCEVRPGLTEEEARAAVTMVDGMFRSISTMSSGPRPPGRVMKDMVLGGLLAVGDSRPRGRAGVSTPSRGWRRRRSLDEEQFRQEVADLPRGDAPGEGRVPEPVGRGTGAHASQGAYQRALAGGGPRRHHLAGRVRRARARRRYQRIFDGEAAGASTCLQRRSRSGSECAARHCWCTPPRSRSTPHPAAAARRARLVRAVQRTGCGLGPASVQTRAGATATSTSSTGRRCGHRAPSTVTTPRAWPGPTRPSPSARASRCSSSTCTRRASQCDRSAS